MTNTDTWIPSQFYLDTVRQARESGRLLRDTFLNLMDESRIDFEVRRSTNPVSDPDRRRNPPVDMVLFTVYLTKTVDNRTVSVRSCELALGDALGDAVVRFDAVRQGPDLPVEEGRCRRCGAPVSTTWIAGGRMKCSECEWPDERIYAAEDMPIGTLVAQAQDGKIVLG